MQVNKHFEKVLWAGFTCLMAFPFQGQAQYFGKNKARYEVIDFKVSESPHFELYHYFDSEAYRNRLLANSEHWYRLHQEIFGDTFEVPNPLIFYQNHPDFQQTTAISGLIGEGTGGVTEGLKNRVVMPAMYSHRQTDHVLGHELVHAFQYHTLTHGDSTHLQNIQNLPLWMVEGLAEYMSIGRKDPHTAMWMRDAVLNDDLPTIRDLNNPKYFPYRYGQAFWAFVTGIWGDTVIHPLFIETARRGPEAAFKKVLGFDSKTLSNMWKSALKTAYAPLLTDSVRMTRPPGKLIASPLNAGDMNLSPALSPDGKYMAFLSEKNVISIDLYISDTRTGKIIKKISRGGLTDHIDAYSFLESAGTWSPDSRRFAMTVISKGKNQLLVIDLQKKKEELIEIPGLSAFSHPAWSPDGASVVVSGLKEGQSDLYQYDLKKKKVRNLTDDLYSDLQPAWSADGRYLAFVTDRVGDPERLEKAHFSLAVMDMAQGDIAIVHAFHGADNLNPVFSPDNESIYFLSDRDGFRNLYRYELAKAQTYQLTDFFTGISGITEYSPALTIARNEGTLAYSYYQKNRYHIYLAGPGEWLEKPVGLDEVDQLPAMLPPVLGEGLSVVTPNLEGEERVVSLPEDSIREKKYQPRFQLDYIGNSGIGIGVSNFGTGLAGGVSMLFSDILGNNQVFSTIAMNGEIYDLGGQVAFINQKRKIHWGAGLSHIPYRAARFGLGVDTVNIGGEEAIVQNLVQENLRQFEDRLSLFAYYPFSLNQRVEAGASLAWYYFRRDRINHYYDFFGNFIGQDRDKLDAPDGYSLQQVYGAYVGDNATFGLTSPLDGMRYRLQAEKYFGELNLYGVLADFRQYHFKKPVSIGYRLYHYSRLGAEAENNRLTPLFLGFPSLMHGYFGNALSRQSQNGLNINDLTGSRLLVANVEVRLPFTGPEKLALIKSKFLLTDLNWFFDAGVAWDSDTRPVLKFNPDQGDERIPVMSTGLSLRLNLFGYMVLEPYYAFPIQRGEFQPGVFGVNFQPGW